MDPIQIVVLALVQGITEFLPISSSGHLVLTPVLFGWPDQGLTMDIAVHVGTLFAVMLYFRRDMFAMARGVVALARGMWTAEAKLLCLVAVGTVPVVAVGAAVAHYDLTDGLRNAEAIGWSTLGFGILLWLSDRLGMTLRRVEHMGVPGAALIGCAQVLALIPGASRSGLATRRRTLRRSGKMDSPSTVMRFRCQPFGLSWRPVATPGLRVMTQRVNPAT